ncbi:UxaA family hydrolase [Clostridium pasteurianum]|uniref:Altronate dehydratase n=1 Tax=Clostridium pasteurianum BC1 TaxID=86416 RepID=R4K5M9_CLOPA|nr:UxaA family hydrolase [Clostridium pasteurianum]AGK95844.1 altronate dehydratase [Clostridium pasteurianum BC1]
MENKINSLLINAKDSVAVAIEELKEGSAASYKDREEIKEVNIIQNIPIYHKFAIINIKDGDLVYKYGQVIGRATQDIKIGQHIHTHNIVSIREAIEG